MKSSFRSQRWCENGRKNCWQNYYLLLIGISSLICYKLNCHLITDDDDADDDDSSEWHMMRWKEVSKILKHLNFDTLGVEKFIKSVSLECLKHSKDKDNSIINHSRLNEWWSLLQPKCILIPMLMLDYFSNFNFEVMDIQHNRI